MDFKEVWFSKDIQESPAKPQSIIPECIIFLDPSFNTDPASIIFPYSLYFSMTYDKNNESRFHCILMDRTLTEYELQCSINLVKLNIYMRNQAQSVYITIYLMAFQ
jgi:hypothetical protein